MARYITIWRFNPSAPWPTDPVEYAKLEEMYWASMDNIIKGGLIEEFGFFSNGMSGYAICHGEAINHFTASWSSWPWSVCEIYEVLPYETAKEAAKGLMKAQAEAMAAVKQ